MNAIRCSDRGQSRIRFTSIKSQESKWQSWSAEIELSIIMESTQRVGIMLAAQ